ncbi:MAG: thioredoxin fold domain-containing protein [Pseudomonadota bacterium]
MKTRQITAAGLLALGALAMHFVNAGTGLDDTIRKAVSNVLPDATIDAITPAPIPGISEVLLGTKLYYVSNDGKYIIDGTLIELATRTDLSAQRLSSVRHELMKKVSEKDMIIFPADKPRHTLTVFTDIDCGYCRKLHNDIASYNAEGITVRYLPFPRTGPNTPSYYKAVSVWCSEDRRDALTRAKSGADIPRTTCDNPVLTSLELGHELGVSGTPALVLEDGQLLPGYVPPKKLAQVLEKYGL